MITTIILVNSKPDLATLLEKITPENIHQETETGDLIGKETW